MDVYSQLQEKLDDISQRFAHEARYFQVCAPPRAEGSEKVHDPIEESPFPETEETLTERAQHSAHAIVALNVQVEQLLGMLPGDEGGEAEQLRELEALVKENEEAGAAVRREREKVRAVLGKVRGVMGDVCTKGGGEIRQEWCVMGVRADESSGGADGQASVGSVAVKQEEVAGGAVGGGSAGAGGSGVEVMEVDDGEPAPRGAGAGAGAAAGAGGGGLQVKQEIP